MLFAFVCWESKKSKIFAFRIPLFQVQCVNTGFLRGISNLHLAPIVVSLPHVPNRSPNTESWNVPF